MNGAEISAQRILRFIRTWPVHRGRRDLSGHKGRPAGLQALNGHLVQLLRAEDHREIGISCKVLANLCMVRFGRIYQELGRKFSQCDGENVPDTMLLDANWDWTVDANGNIAVAEAPLQLAQDAASAIRCFQSELIFDTTQGVPYDLILGKTPSLAYLKAQMVAAAQSVIPSNATATCFITGIFNRQVTGQVQIVDANGITSVAAF